VIKTETVTAARGKGTIGPIFIGTGGQSVALSGRMDLRGASAMGSVAESDENGGNGANAWGWG